MSKSRRGGPPDDDGADEVDRIESLPDIPKWSLLNRVTYHGHKFTVARSNNEAHERPWCAWSSDPDLPNIMGMLSAESILNQYKILIEMLD